jgi:hypothetical protein
MSIDVDTSVTVRCDECLKHKREDEVVNYCRACEENKRPTPEPIMAWADRKLLLGQITREQFDFLDHVAKDIELGKTPVTAKKRAA